MLEWVAILFTNTEIECRDLPNAEIEPGSPALQADCLLSKPSGKQNQRRTLKPSPRVRRSFAERWAAWGWVYLTQAVVGHTVFYIWCSPVKVMYRNSLQIKMAPLQLQWITFMEHLPCAFIHLILQQPYDTVWVSTFSDEKTGGLGSLTRVPSW